MPYAFHGSNPTLFRASIPLKSPPMGVSSDAALGTAAVYRWELDSPGTQTGAGSDLLAISGTGMTTNHESA